MSRELRIGVTEPAPDSPAFAVSRDSAGILIGVRDNAAPQFAVSRNADGLLLSAWPVASLLPSPVFRSVAERIGSVQWRDNPHLAAVPAGLTVGDLIILFVGSLVGVPSGVPAGFAELHQIATGTHKITVYTKTADAGDVAAAHFSVPNAGPPEPPWGPSMSSFTYAFENGGGFELVASIYEASGGRPRTIDVTDFTPTTAKPVVLWASTCGSWSTESHINGGPMWRIADGLEGEMGFDVSRIDDPSGLGAGPITTVGNSTYNSGAGSLVVLVLGPAVA